MWIAVIIAAWLATGYIGGRLVIKYDNEDGWTGFLIMMMGPIGLFMGALSWADSTAYEGPDFDKMWKRFFNVKD